MTLYWWATLAIVVILVASGLARAIPGFVFICARDGTTMVSSPQKFPTYCRDGHRMRMLFPSVVYATMILIGDLAMCTLIAHFILQRYIPWALSLVSVLAVLGVVAGVKDLVTIPPKVRPEHRPRVRGHYVGALAGHAVALAIIFSVDWSTI